MVMDGNRPQFTVGGVISTSVSIVVANLFRFLVIILGVGVSVAVLLGIGAAVMAIGATPNGTGVNVTLEGGSIARWLFIICALFLGLLAYFLIQSALTFGALQHLRGRPVAIGACFSNGFAALPRVFLASLMLFVVGGAVAWLAVMIAGTLFASAGGAAGVVIGIGFAAAFLFVVVLIWVFVPAIVVERAGPYAAFSRSAALTKGRRWSIFGILLLVGVANWIISFVSQLLQSIAPVAGSAIDVASGLFFMALGSVLSAVGYYYLRAEKEGVAIDDVVTVFD